MLCKLEVLSLITLLGFSTTLFADQVTLKNGDRLTGTVVKSDGKDLVLHTDAAGDVTLKFDAIQEIKTDADLHVTLKDGKTAVGPVTTTDGKLEIVTKTSGTVEAPKEDVTLIRNDAEQQAYDKSLHPGLMPAAIPPRRHRFLPVCTPAEFLLRLSMSRSMPDKFPPTATLSLLT